MTYLKSALAWALYWMGTVVSRGISSTGCWTDEVLYPTYNTLMGWSVDLDVRGWVWPSELRDETFEEIK